MKFCVCRMNNTSLLLSTCLQLVYLELAETIGLMFSGLNTQTYTLVIIIQIKGT